MSADFLQALFSPFPPGMVEWRVGSTTADKTKGMALAYIDARAVMDRLDAVCGVDGWQNRYTHTQGKTVCEIGIRVGTEWIWKSDGAGDTDVEAEKGALSDAFKRAAVRWGVGRYLYDLEAVWVDLEPAGKSYRIKKSEQAKLDASLARGLAGVKQVTPAEAKRNGDFEKMRAEINSCDNVDALSNWWKNNQPRILALPDRGAGQSWRELLVEHKDKRKAELESEQKLRDAARRHGLPMDGDNPMMDAAQ